MHTNEQKGSVLLESIVFVCVWLLLHHFIIEIFGAYRNRGAAIRRERNIAIQNLPDVPPRKTQTELGGYSPSLDDISSTISED